MEAECPREANCSCSLSVVPDLHAQGPGGARVFRPMVTVDCAGRGLRQLPPELPANATTLHVEHNQISDLRPLVTNEHYRGVLDVYLDGNGVRSVAALEGSAWLLRFRLLSLRGNRLARLPTYALESALQRNRHAARLYLGDNPWTCDCQSTPSFQ
ncbi:Protein singed wings 2, partial [Gryllus bimaculatus]